MNFFKKMFKLNRNLTPAEKVAHANTHAEDALNMFSQAHDKLEHANSILAEAHQEALHKLEQAQKDIEKAIDGINMNRNVQEKLKDFIVR
jgi:hypothetical protein